ncbi:MAG: hypothetical protein ACREX4_17300 [Gammaproteobacteria bacterium]
MIARTAPAAAPASTLTAVSFITVLATETFLEPPFLVPPFLLAGRLLADALLLTFFAAIVVLT